MCYSDTYSPFSGLIFTQEMSRVDACTGKVMGLILNEGAFSLDVLLRSSQLQRL